MDSVLAEWPFVIFLEKNGEFIFTGPYKVQTYVKDTRFDLVPNTHYPRAAERPSLKIVKHANSAALETPLKNGELDMAFHLSVNALPELRQASGVTLKSFTVGYQYMMWHNMRKTV